MDIRAGRSAAPCEMAREGYHAVGHTLGVCKDVGVRGRLGLVQLAEDGGGAVHTAAQMYDTLLRSDSSATTAWGCPGLDLCELRMMAASVPSNSGYHPVHQAGILQEGKLMRCGVFQGLRKHSPDGTSEHIACRTSLKSDPTA